MATFADLVLVTLVQTIYFILGLSIAGKTLRGYVRQYIVIAVFLFPYLFVWDYIKYRNGYIFQPVLVLITYGYLVILLKMVFKRMLSKIFLELIIYLIILNIVELSMAATLHLLINIKFDEFNRIGGALKILYLESSVLLVIYKFLPIRGYIERYENVLFKYLLFALNIFIIFLITASFTKGFKPSPQVFSVVFFLFLSILLTTFLTIKVFSGPREEIALHEQFLEFEKTLEPVLDEFHTIQYDFQHHLKIMSELCTNAKRGSDLVQGVNKYGLEASKTLGDVENSLRLSNKVLEAIIYCKFQEAKAKKIDLQCKILDKEIGFPLKNYEYTTVIANLLDNACEAVEKNAEAVLEKDGADIKGKVTLELGRQKQQSYIEVRNTGSIQEENIPNLLKKGYSTKEENLGKRRGLGLYNVKKMVDKYSGNIEVYNWHDQVVFRVSF